MRGKRSWTSGRARPSTTSGRSASARAHRIAVAEPDLDGIAGGAEVAGQLLAQPRLAGAGGRGDEHGARRGVLDRVGDDALEQRDLALAADERRRAAEQGARRLVGV